MKENYGTSIERGLIAEVLDDGYKVRSLTREGIVTLSLPSIGGADYEIGDRVYFFVFDDGHGAILAAF